MNITQKQVRAALWRQFPGSTNDKGYVDRPEENLIDGVHLRMFESDLRKGAGNELANHFLAVHSSSALAVNAFAPFTETPEKLTCCGKSQFTSAQFEQACRTELSGTPPHLDVWLQRGDGAIGKSESFTRPYHVMSTLLGCNT